MRRLWLAGLVAMIGLALAAQAGTELKQTRDSNATILAFAADANTQIGPESPAAVQAARGISLLAHGRPEDAQSIADHLAGIDTGSRALLLYDLGNFMLRRGLSLYFIRPMRETAPIIRIAQAEYREALRLDPENWDARFNLDVADALVRDAGTASPTTGTQMAHDRADVPNEPGAPSGLP